MPRRQQHDLLASANEKRVISNQERSGSMLKGYKRRVEIAVATGSQDMKLSPKRARRGLQISRLGCSTRISRVDEEADHGGIGYQLAQQLQSLCPQRGEQ